MSYELISRAGGAMRDLFFNSKPETEKSKPENISISDLYSQFIQGELTTKDINMMLADNGTEAIKEFIKYHQENKVLIKDQKSLKEMELTVKRLTLFINPKL